MALEISGNTVVNDSRKATFNVINIGTYTTSTRPSSPSPGDMIYNSTTEVIEYWTGSTWRSTYYTV